MANELNKNNCFISEFGTYVVDTVRQLG